MTIITHPKPAADLMDKRAVIDIMESQTPSENRRLDGVEAFCAAYDVFVRAYDPAQHAECMPKPFFREHAIADFMRIKNLKAMVWAFDWLVANYPEGASHE